MLLKQSLRVCTFALLLACEPQDSVDHAVSLRLEEASAVPVSHVSKAQIALLANTIWQQGLDALQNNQTQAEKLSNAIGVLLASPNQKNLTAARQQWRLSFLAYQQLAPFLSIRAGRVDARAHHSIPLTNSALNKLREWRFALAAWPLRPGYLDSYGVHLHSGIVNDIAFPITARHLRKQHGLTDSEEVILGLHAIEFMLWAGDSKTAVERFIKKTKVPLVLAQSGLKQSELPNNRRRALIALQAQLFQQDLSALVGYWQPNGLFARSFQQLKPLEKISAIHNGLRLSIDNLYTLFLNNGSKGDIYALHFNAFAGQRQQAITEALSAIEALYFVGDTSLISLFFPVAEQQQLAALLTEIKKQMNNENDADYTFTINALSQVITLLAARTTPIGLQVWHSAESR